MNDAEILKLHGYVFSLSDSDNSDSEDEAFVTGNNTRAKEVVNRTTSCTDSGRSSSLSDFDDEYYAAQPPPIRLDEYRHLIVKIKAVKDETTDQRNDGGRNEKCKFKPLSKKNPWKNLTRSTETFRINLAEFPLLPGQNEKGSKPKDARQDENVKDSSSCFNKCATIKSSSDLSQIETNSSDITSVTLNAGNIVKNNENECVSGEVSQKCLSHEIILAKEVTLNAEKLHSHSNVNKLKSTQSQLGIYLKEFPLLPKCKVQRLSCKNKCKNENVENYRITNCFNNNNTTKSTSDLLQIETNTSDIASITLNAGNIVKNKENECASGEVSQKHLGHKIIVANEVTLNAEKLHSHSNVNKLKSSQSQLDINTGTEFDENYFNNKFATTKSTSDLLQIETNSSDIASITLNAGNIVKNKENQWVSGEVSQKHLGHKIIVANEVTLNAEKLHSHSNVNKLKSSQSQLDINTGTEFDENCFNNKFATTKSTSDLLQIETNSSDIASITLNAGNIVKNNENECVSAEVSQKPLCRKIIIANEATLNTEKLQSDFNVNKLKSAQSQLDINTGTEFVNAIFEKHGIYLKEFPVLPKFEVQSVNCKNENVENCINKEHDFKEIETNHSENMGNIIVMKHIARNLVINDQNEYTIDTIDEISQSCEVQPDTVVDLNIEKPNTDHKMHSTYVAMTTCSGMNNSKFIHECQDTPRKAIPNKSTEHRSKQKTTRVTHFKAIKSKSKPQLAKAKHEVSFDESKPVVSTTEMTNRSLQTRYGCYHNVLVNSVESNFKNIKLARDNKAVLTRKRIAAGRRWKRNMQSSVTSDMDIIISAIILFVILYIVYKILCSISFL